MFVVGSVLYQKCMGTNVEEAMEVVLFIIIWIGGASLQTLFELHSKRCCSAGILKKVPEEQRCISCRREW